MKTVFSFAALTVFGITFLFTGIYDVLKNYEANNCQMTYMYDWPMYDSMFMGNRMKQLFPSYQLVYYFEGFTSHTSNTKFTGIPVLFIPGNAGSEKQVRSLGSVALRMAEHIESSFHFDFFSIDFNEEHSGLYGGILDRQTEYVGVCIKKILSFYSHLTNPPKSVILIGHSMGGMLARAVFTLPKFDALTVSLIITQATPHLSPVVPFDSLLMDFYTKTNGFWRAHANTTFSHVTMVSTGGGFRDVLVRQGLTDIYQIVSKDKAVSTSTMTVPKSWVSTDHLCAVWCRQMVLVTVRALFDSIDQSSNQVSSDHYKVHRVFKHHFISNNNFKFDENIPLHFSLPKDSVPTQKENFVFHAKHVKKNFAISIPVKQSAKRLTVITNITTTDWIGLCHSPHLNCSNLENLSEQSFLIPSPSNHKKVLHLDVSSFSLISTILLNVASTSKSVYISAAFDGPALKHFLPTLTSIISNYPHSVMSQSPVLTINPDQQYPFYNVTLVGLSSVLQAYRLIVETKNCQNFVDTNEASAIILRIPWAEDHTNLTFRKSDSPAVMSIKLQTPRPSASKSYPQLHIYTQPGCQYDISIRPDLPQLLGQFVRFYGVLLPAFIVATLLISLSSNNENDCAKVLSPWLPLDTKLWCLMFLATMTIVYVLRIAQIDTYLAYCDFGLLNAANLWSPILYPLLYLLSLAVLSFHTLILHCSLIVAGKTFGFVTKCISIPASFRYYIHLLMLVILAVAVLLSISVFGLLGLFICYILQFFKALNAYSVSNGVSTKKHVALLNLVLWMWLCILNSAPLVFWIKNLQYSVRLPADPTLVTSPILILSFLILNIFTDTTLPKQRLVKIVYCLSTVILTLTSPVSMYRITFILTMTLLLEACVVFIAQFYTVTKKEKEQKIKTKVN